jgi:hypothetical protein
MLSLSYMLFSGLDQTSPDRTAGHLSTAQGEYFAFGLAFISLGLNKEPAISWIER